MKFFLGCPMPAKILLFVGYFAKSCRSYFIFKMILMSGDYVNNGPHSLYKLCHFISVHAVMSSWTVPSCYSVVNRAVWFYCFIFCTVLGQLLQCHTDNQIANVVNIIYSLHNLCHCLRQDISVTSLFQTDIAFHCFKLKATMTEYHRQCRVKFLLYLLALDSCKIP